MMIREAHEEDIDQMVSIEEYCYETPWPREAFDADINDSELGIGFVADDDGYMVGFATGLSVASEFHLHNIAVHPDHRGRGIARQLLEKIDEYCHLKELRKILLEVRRDNDQARRLYLGMGYESVGMRKDYYGPGRDAYLFTKILVED